MSSAALADLSARIAANSLTPGQQAALTEALAGIIPTFPEPDEISNSIPLFEEDLARLWFAALYAVAAEGGSPMPAPDAATILFPDRAAAEAFDVSLAPVGQPAQIETFGAEFTLQPIGSMVVDGATVIATTSPTLVWERGDTIVAVAAALQLDWHVNGATGDDEATGLTALTALQTKAEIMRRLGSWAPSYDGITVTIHYDAADSAPGDPALFRPYFLNGAKLLEKCELPAPSFTGTLLAVTPKSQALLGGALQSTFATTTGAVVAGMLLINTTRGSSRALAQRNRGGGNWQIAQPFTAEADPTNPSRTPVDTWANGDAIVGYVLIAVDIARVGGQVVEFAPVGFSHTIYQLTVLDPLGIGFEDAIEVDGSGYPLFLDVVCQRSKSLTAADLFSGMSVNTWFQQPVSALSIPGTTAFLANGGIVDGPGVLRGIAMQSGTILTGTIDTFDSFFVDVCVDDGATLIGNGDMDMSSVGAVLYGGGTYNSRYGATRYLIAAETQFTLAGGLQLNGIATGYSLATSVGVTTVHGGIALTPAALDAAAGAAGFGGYAFGGGACFVRQGTQP